jgi:hypothetical protein
MVMSKTSPSILTGRHGATAAALALVAIAAVTPTTLFAAPTTRWVNDNSLLGYSAPGTSCSKPGYATIQAAVTAAGAGDTVRVCSGTYTENVSINKPNLAVVSTNGAAVTRVRSVTAAAVFSLTQPNVTLDGFTILPVGTGVKYDIGVNVNIGGNASAEIAHNVIVNGRIGINLGCGSSASTIYHNTVRGSTETGINIDTCEYDLPIDELPGSTANSVHHNTVCGGLYPYSIAAGAGSHNNHIHHNSATWITAYGKGNHVHNNVAELFTIWPGNLAHNNTVADVCR